MTTTTGPTAKLCQWACATQYEALPAEVRKETLTLLSDQIGCMIACATLPSCRPVVNLVRRLGSQGECTIVGHPLRASVTRAALTNGTIGHADEVDSTGKQGTGHVAAVIVPTALSVGQYMNVSGKELCRAIAIGAETSGRVVTLLNHYALRDQFDATVGHALGAAVCAGLLLKLDPEQMEYAIGLAAGGACGLNTQHNEELHEIKALDKGRAAAVGTESALLALEGCHGPKEPLTIENGFFDAYLGLPSAGNEVVHGLGEKFLMREVAYKRYSVGGPDQTPLYGFLKIVKNNGLTADDIEHIEVSVSRGAYETVTSNHQPAVHLETILSLAAVYGEITFNHIHDERYRKDPRVKAFLDRARIYIVPRPGAAARGERLNMTMTVRTTQGKVLREQLGFQAMSEAEIQQKFRNLAGLRLDSQQVANLENKLKGIETEPAVAPFIRQHLEIPYK